MKIVGGINLLTIFAKSCIIDVCQCPKNALVILVLAENSLTKKSDGTYVLIAFKNSLLVPTSQLCFKVAWTASVFWWVVGVERARTDFSNIKEI